MAVLALAAVGSAVGAWAIPGTILGMSGAGFGWMVGSMAGSLLFPPKAPDGPRLEDKSVQVSTYGQPIPRIYGTHRMAGNVIWSTDLIETATEEGGKGGPSYTTYSYRASFAVSICQGPIVGIRRIWADGKLIFDQSETNTGPQKDFNAESLAIYLGDESQLPDPTIQALQGDTPAYRGQAYVVFTDLQLEKFGNRLPSLTFEVVQSGSIGARPSSLIIPKPASASGTAQRSAVDPETGYVWTVYGNGVMTVYDPNNLRIVATVNTGIDNPSNIVVCAPARTVWVASSSVFNNPVNVYSADGYALINTFDVGSFWLAGYDPQSASMLFGSSYLLNDSVRRVNVASYAFSTLNFGVSFLWAGVHVPEFNQFVLTGSNTFAAVTTSSLNFSLVHKLVSADIDTFGVDMEPITLDTSRQLVYRVTRKSDLSVMVYDPSTRAVTFRTLTGATGTPNCIHYHAPTDSLLVGMSLSSGLVLQFDASTFALRKTIILSGVTNPIFSFGNPVDFEDRVYISSPTGLAVAYLDDTLVPAPVPLSTVVTAESALVGLGPSDIGVSELSSVMVAGFSTGGGAARSGLEQMMMAYQFDAVESGGVVKFVRRGGAVVATLDDADLAAHQPGNDVPTPLPLTRAEEIELPQRITIRYPNPAADYQTGAQSAQRLTGRAMAQGGADLPIVLTDSEALRVAEAALYSAWTARISTSFVTTHKHAALEPTDVIVAGGNTLRITKRTENAGLITFDASFEDGNVFTQSALGAAADIPLQTIPLRSRTALEFLDVPPLRDQDDDAGFYVAVSGYAGRWDGAIVYKSLDTGASYTELLSITTAATMGHSIDALTAWTGQNVFDETNSVTIVMRNGTLSSLSELAVLNGGNAALLGEEIIQYKSATLNADGSYTLTGLLRGRKATTTSGHAQGDRFILLNENSLRRAPSDIGELNLSRVYKAATIGTSLSHSNPVSFTNTGKAIDPLAPAHLGGGRSAAGDVAVTWKRRTRIGGAWRDYADVPLAEAVEIYEVDVFSSGTYTTLKRTLTVSTFTSSTLTVTYTAAQQVADFGSTQATVYLRVYQISASAGRGSALQGTV